MPQPYYSNCASVLDLECKEKQEVTRYTKFIAFVRNGHVRKYMYTPRYVIILKLMISGEQRKYMSI